MSWVGLVLVTLVALSGVPAASAHAELLGTTPSNGANLATPPDEVTLRFSEDVQLATVSVTSASGERVGGEARIDARVRTVVHVPLDDVGNGTYLVEWKVLSADGHTVTGAFVFAVGGEPPTRAQLLDAYTQDGDGPSPNPATPVFRALLFGGIVVLVGAPVTLLLVLYPLSRKYELAIEPADRATKVLFGGALLAVFVSGTGLAVSQLVATGSLSPAGLGRFATTASGTAWLVRVGVAVVLGILTALVASNVLALERNDWLTSLFCGGLLLQLTVGWTSHSAAVVDGLLGIVVDVGHLFGASLWMGGLVVLAVLAPGFIERAPGDRSQFSARLISRFSLLAMAGVAVVGATGILLASWHVPTVDSLGSTLYGTTLTVKVVLVLVAVGLGGFNRFVLLRTLRDRPNDPEESGGWTGLSFVQLSGRVATTSAGTVRTFVRSVRLELALLVFVLLLSGVITSIPTAANATGASRSPDALVFESETDGITLTSTVIPGHVGSNVVTVELTADDTPVHPVEPVVITLFQPALDVTLPATELDKISPGRYSAVIPIPADGTWHVRVATWTENAHVVTSYTMTIPSVTGGHAVHRHDSRDVPAESSGDGWFTTLLRIGALAVALLGLLAVGSEAVSVGR